MPAFPRRLVSSILIVLAWAALSPVRTTQAAPRVLDDSTADGQRYVRTVHDSEHGFTFEVETPPAALRFGTDPDGRRVVGIDGLHPVNVPGQPELPVVTVSIGIPDGMDVTLDVESWNRSIHPGAPIRPIQRLDVRTERWTSVPSPSIYRSARLWPDANASVEITQYRDLRIARVQVWPLRYDPTDHALEHHENIQVRLTFRPTSAAKARTFRGRGGALADRMARTSLLNGNTVLELRRRQAASLAPPSVPQPSKAGIGAPAGVRLRIDEPGMARITGAQLAASGFDTASVDPRNLELSYRGTPVPCRILGEDDGVFDNSDALEFYGIPAETRFAKENVYWLAVGAAPGLRFATLDATPQGARIETQFDYTQRVEDENSIYAFDQGSGPDDPHFFWTVFQEGLTENFSDFVEVIDLAPGGDPGQLRVSFLGRTNAPDNPDHHVLFRVAGATIGETMWEGRNAHVAEIPFASSILTNGLKNVRIIYQPIAFPDSYYLDWYEFTYPRLTIADGDVLTIVSEPGTKRFEVSNFRDDDVLVLDVTDPFAPIQLTGASVSGTTRFTALFEVSTVDDRVYHVASRGGRTFPAAVELDLPSNLRDPANGADLIIVTPEGWEDELAPLVTHRQSLGMRVVLANLTDVADEFAGGNVDDDAVRDFVQYAYENWQGPAVSYLLLVGEPTLDPRNWIGTTDPVNAMPTHYTTTNALGDTMSDTWFGTVAGNDLLPDVGVGRYSVPTAGQAEDQVLKTIDYETFGWNGNAWTRRILLVASNESQFEEALEDSLVNVPPDINVVREYRRSGATTASIVGSFDDSALVASFIGHGNVALWADLPGGTYLRTSDVDDITNGRFFPFVTVMNCLNGLIGDPVMRVSLAEAFHENTFNSSVAVWAPTTLGFLSEFRRLQKTMFESIFVDRADTFGAITTEALNKSYLNSPVSLDTVKGMLLLGDPAGTLLFTCRTTNFDLWCNGIDDDCDGSFDEDYVPEAATCGVGPCVNSGVTVCNDGVIESDCEPLPPPSPDDADCDLVDDDCDGSRDEDFAVEPTSCGVGACAAVGSSYCFFGSVLDNCEPLQGADSDPFCDGVDEDCDGIADEDYAPESAECGFGPCVAVGETFCSDGVIESDCVPLDPDVTEDTVCDGVDEDCDGVADDDFVPVESSCGIGGCLARGTSTCLDGQVDEVCIPGDPTDEVCSDSIDNDCDGMTNEDDAIDATLFYADGDQDGFGDAAATTAACVAPAGFVANDFDCNDSAADAWRTPGEVVGLRFDPADDDRLLWDEPNELGGSPIYVVLRSDFPDTFDAATCASGPVPQSTSFVDASDPGPFQVFSYLVRAENDCPDGMGPLGTASSGAERIGTCAP